MKLSIVVPTYNQGPYIAECLESIRTQTFQNFEVIIQDSVSNDETQEICERYSKQDARFRYFREKDSGQSDAINRGLRRSTGELWTWICSDDYYADTNAMEALVNALETSSSDIVGSFGKAQFVSEDGICEGEYFQLHKDIKKIDFKLTWPLSQPSSILRTDAIKRINGVKEDLHLNMDLDMFLRLLDGDRSMAYVPVLAACVRVQPQSKSVKFERASAENSLRLIKLHFGDTGSPYQSAYWRELGRCAFEIPGVKKIKLSAKNQFYTPTGFHPFKFLVFGVLKFLNLLAKKLMVTRVWLARERWI